MRTIWRLKWSFKMYWNCLILTLLFVLLDIIILLFRASGTVYTAIDVATGHEVRDNLLIFLAEWGLVKPCWESQFLIGFTYMTMDSGEINIIHILGRYQTNEFITTTEKGNLNTKIGICQELQYVFPIWCWCVDYYFSGTYYQWNSCDARKQTCEYCELCGQLPRGGRTLGRIPVEFIFSAKVMGPLQCCNEVHVVLPCSRI